MYPHYYLLFNFKRNINYPIVLTLYTFAYFLFVSIRTPKPVLAISLEIFRVIFIYLSLLLTTRIAFNHAYMYTHKSVAYTRITVE